MIAGVPVERGGAKEVRIVALTLAGFVREGRLNVYAKGRRIAGQTA